MKPNEVYQKYQERFVGRIEEMSNEEIKEVFKDAQEAEMPKLRTVPYMGEPDEEITYEFPELTGLCPMTGLPDSYTIVIRYCPGPYLPELKSLRDYFLAYRNLPITHENLTAKIKIDFKNAVCPTLLNITLDVAVRGGIKTYIIRG